MKIAISKQRRWRGLAPPKAAGIHAAGSVNEVIQPAAGRTALVERLDGAAAVQKEAKPHRRTASS